MRSLQRRGPITQIKTQDPKGVLFICRASSNFAKIGSTKHRSGLSHASILTAKEVGGKSVDALHRDDAMISIAKYNPEKVIIEGLWLNAQDIKTMEKLFPKSTFYVRTHSKVPFLVVDGMASEYLNQYDRANIKVIFNHQYTYDALNPIYPKTIVLENLYSKPFRKIEFKEKDTADIVCMGAIRMMKNQYTQAIAAVHFAKAIGKKLRFHLNTTRVEGAVTAAVTNIKRILEDRCGFQVVDIPWLDPEEVLDYCQNMDIGMQLSFTESFNIVTADYITAGLPIVVSKEIDWVREESITEIDNIPKIVEAMKIAYKNQELVEENQRLLSQYHARAKVKWIDFLHK